jgi:uncharacterized protein (UPF0332 family)
MLDVGLNDDAGRAAYLAAFHAAQAVVFERTGKATKSHRGVQSEFLRLTKDDPCFTAHQRIFRSQAYTFKAVADCEISFAKLSADQAAAALERGRGFMNAVRRGLTPASSFGRSQGIARPEGSSPQPRPSPQHPSR